MQHIHLQTAQTTQKGKPITPGTNTAHMPRVLCWNCGRPIAWGAIIVPTDGKPVLLKCTRRECLQFNQFDIENAEAA